MLKKRMNEVLLKQCGSYNSFKGKIHVTVIRN